MDLQAAKEQYLGRRAKVLPSVRDLGDVSAAPACFQRRKDQQYAWSRYAVCDVQSAEDDDGVSHVLLRLQFNFFGCDTANRFLWVPVFFCERVL
jgi:hypothetical protein